MYCVWCLPRYKYHITPVDAHITLYSHCHIVIYAYTMIILNRQDRWGGTYFTFILIFHNKRRTSHFYNEQSDIIIILCICCCCSWWCIMSESRKKQWNSSDSWIFCSLYYDIKHHLYIIISYCLYMWLCVCYLETNCCRF